jgi:hypothetical protein
VTLSDGKVITATEGHPFRTAEGWRDAVLLKQGDTLILTGSDGKPSTIQVDGIRYETKVLTTYNLEVANAHTFFVGEDAVLVHNHKCNIGVNHSTRKRALEAAAHSHGGKPRPTPKKDAPSGKRKAYEEQQKYKQPERHLDSDHPENHFHDSNKSDKDTNVHHKFPKRF